MKLTRSFSRYVNNKYPNWDITIAIRYLPIVKDLKRKLSQNSKILDVGSGEFGLATYLKGKYRVVGTDIDFGEKRSKGFEQVKVSADKLPFKDSSFDAVVSVDMVEHLSGKIRKRSVEEMVRVTRNDLYIAFPRGKFSSLIDRFIAKYYHLTHRENLDYLKEHIKYGLPDEKNIIGMIKSYAKRRSRKVEVRTSGNTNSFLWTLLLMMGFSQIKPITYIYHKMVLFLPIMQYLHLWPTYRVIIYARFN